MAETEQQRWVTTYRSSNLDIIDQWQEQQKKGEDEGRQSSDVTRVRLKLFIEHNRMFSSMILVSLELI